MLQKLDTGETDYWRGIVLQKFCILYFSQDQYHGVQQKKKYMKRENQIRKETSQVDGWVSSTC